MARSANYGRGCMDELIKQELTTADIIILLVSIDFIASDYILEK